MKFPLAYQPLPKGIQVKIKATGKPMELPQEAEEMACWWSEAENTEFGEKAKVKENFWLDFGQKLDKVSKI
jgi:DNA topoisomerase-1